jgi:hypothetical protein
MKIGIAKPMVFITIKSLWHIAIETFELKYVLSLRTPMLYIGVWQSLTFW